jgi:Ca-activated chloride channel family protein
MNRRSAIRTFAIASAVLSFSHLMGNPSLPQDGFTIRSDVRLVLLDVAVKNKQSRFVYELPKQGFRVIENGRPQLISVFANKDVPVTVGILVDESQSMGAKRDEVLNAAQTFIEKSNPEDEIFVVNFNDKVMPGLKAPTLFSDNIEELRSALYRGVPQGKTAIYDAIVAGLTQLESGRRDKKALIVISDGGDNASRHKRADMLNMVWKSLATIYAIGIYDAEDPDRDPGLLEELAKVSGGEALFPKSPSGMSAACTAIAEEIRSRYTIGYVPQPGAAPLRRIHIRVHAPDGVRLTAHTRPRYRYEAVANQNGK